MISTTKNPHLVIQRSRTRRINFRVCFKCEVYIIVNLTLITSHSIIFSLKLVKEEVFVSFSMKVTIRSLLTIESDNHWNLAWCRKHKHRYPGYWFRCRCHWRCWSDCWDVIFTLIGVTWTSIRTIFLEFNFETFHKFNDLHDCTASYSMCPLKYSSPHMGNRQYDFWSKRHIHFRNHHCRCNGKCTLLKTFHLHRYSYSSWYSRWHSR